MPAKFGAFIAFGLTLMATGCAVSKESVRPRVSASTERSIPLSPNENLTAAQAVELALEFNPRLKASAFDIGRAEARSAQATLLPNPEIEVEVEDFGGSGEFRGDTSLETTLAVSQLVQLGGKRRKRGEVAQRDIDLSKWSQDSARLDVANSAKRAVIETALAQDNLALRRGLLEIAEKVSGAIGERVKAGRVLPIEETRARIDQLSRNIERDRAELKLKSARKSLALVWGSDRPKFGLVEFRLDAISPPPEYDSLKSHLSANPDLARWTSEAKRRQASLELERSRRIPDITLTGGVRRFNETDDHSFVVGFSMPLPIFNRNQGAIREAEIDLESASFEMRSAEALLIDELARAYRDLVSAYEGATLLRSQILPGAESTFDAIQEGYREGKFGYLEVLDAQKTLFEANSQYLEALGNFHLSTTAIERLIAQPISSLSTENKD